MPAKDEKPQDSTSVQKPVDLDNSESRMSFLKDELNDMLDGINNVYGQDLMEELLKRLEKTVEDFNGEVSGLIGKLKAGKIFEEDTPEESPKDADSDDDATEGDEDPEKSFEEQEEEDQDIIARMRKRVSHD